MRKIAGQLRKIDINFLGLGKHCCQPGNTVPLCTVPEVKENYLQVQKGVFQIIFNKTTFFGVTNEVLITLISHTWVFRFVYYYAEAEGACSGGA